MASSLGSLIIEIQGNVARLENDMRQMEGVVNTHVGRIDKAAESAGKSIENIGSGSKNVGRIKGVDEMVDQMDHLNFKTVAARRELLVLAHEASQGNWSKFGGSLMVLGERVDAMSLIFSKAGLVIGGLVGIMAGFVVAVAKGAIEAEHLKKSLELTNNAAGVTASSFSDLARSIADSTNKTIGSSREALAAIVATGQFTRTQLQSASADIMAIAALTGGEMEKIAEDFGKMREGVSKWAEEHNRAWHYMSAAQYDYIRNLENTGQTEKALMANLETLHSRFADTSQEKLGIVVRMWRAVRNEISNVVDALKSIGRPETTADQIRGLEAMLKGVKVDNDPSSTMFKWRQQKEQELANLREMQRMEAAQASRQSVIDQQQQAAIKATDDLEKLRIQFDKAAAKQKEINDVNVRFQQLAIGNPNSPLLKGVQVKGSEQSGFAFSGGEYDRIIKGINDRYKDKSQAGIDKANLDARLRPIEDEIKAQDALLSQREAMLKRYHEADQISTADYYAGQRAAIEEHIDKVRADYAREAAIVREFSKTASDERQRIEASTKAKDLEERMNRAIAADMTKLNELVPQQAKEMETYRLEVEKLNAELAKLHGHLGENVAENFDRMHDKLTKQATLQADTGTLDRLAETKRLTVAQGELNEQNKQAQIILEALRVREDGINQAVRLGQTNEIDGMLQIGQARADSLRQLQAIGDKINEIAIGSGNEQMLLFATQFDQKLKDIQGSSDVLGNKLSTAFGHQFAKDLEAVVNRTKSLKDAVLDFANAITNMITQMAANSLAQQLFGGLFSSGGAGGESGGGGLGGLIGMVASYFGGAMADGGETSPGKFYRVNENGPELYTVANRTYLMSGNQSGSVTPVGSGVMSGGRSTVMHMNITVPPGTSRQTAQQQAAEIMRHAQIASVRNT